jgi:hypothetical protein
MAKEDLLNLSLAFARFVCRHQCGGVPQGWASACNRFVLCFMPGKARFEHWQFHNGGPVSTLAAEVERLISPRRP